MARKNKNKKTCIDTNKLVILRRDAIKNKRLTDNEITMIEDKFKTARNEKGKPQVDNTETESKDNEIYLDFDGEGEAVILKDCKMIVEDAVRNDRTANGNVNECTVRKLSK